MSISRVITVQMEIHLFEIKRDMSYNMDHPVSCGCPAMNNLSSTLQSITRYAQGLNIHALVYQEGQDLVGVPAGVTLEHYQAMQKIVARMQSATPKLFASPL